MAGASFKPDESFAGIDFINKESAGGLVLIASAVFALYAANSSLAPLYAFILNTPIIAAVGELVIAKSALLWINDGLMALFFFLIGLEVKREFTVGQMRNREAALFPLAAAIGGMAIPALAFVAIASSDPAAIRGWAIPAATDIAFALGVLALMGRSVPTALKALLLAVAIIDDVGAITIIALFYTETVNLTALGLGGFALVALLICNRLGVARSMPYMLIGLFLWVCVLKSGLHATLAGVVTAMFVPVYVRGEEPLERMEHALHPYISFFVLPVFAFANAGVSMEGVSLSGLLDPLPLGIMVGLLIGKPIGIVGFAWIAEKTGLASRPAGLSWTHIIGLSFIAGIGFTMSLFIASLAFGDPAMIAASKLGVITGSLLAIVAGVTILKGFARPVAQPVASTS